MVDEILWWSKDWHGCSSHSEGVAEHLAFASLNRCSLETQVLWYQIMGSCYTQRRDKRTQISSLVQGPASKQYIGTLYLILYFGQIVYAKKWNIPTDLLLLLLLFLLLLLLSLSLSLLLFMHEFPAFLFCWMNWKMFATSTYFRPKPTKTSELDKHMSSV